MKEATLDRIHRLEEEVEALRRAFQALLFAEAIDAEQAGRDPLAAHCGALDYDEHRAKTEEPDNARLLRIIDRAQQILSDGLPQSYRED